MTHDEAATIARRWRQAHQAVQLAHQQLQQHPLGPKRDQPQDVAYWESFDRLSQQLVDPARVDVLVQHGDLNQPSIVQALQNLERSSAALEENVRQTLQRFEDAQQLAGLPH